MEKEGIKQKPIAELNDNSILLYAERQKFKESNLPKDLMEKMRIKFIKQKKISMIAFGILGAYLIIMQFLIVYSNSPSAFLKNSTIQFFPLLGVLFFQMNRQNLGKKIFILGLLLNWEE